MQNKIIQILMKVVFYLILFIFVTGFIIIPLALTWAIPSQGTKFLKHSVHIRSVQFNPLILQLTLNGFEVSDDQDQLMVGFDKLMVQVSFKDLFKKVYHVKEIELDGLKVNVELLPKNQVNLLELVPEAPTQTNRQATASKEQSAILPDVIIDKINLHQAKVHFIDRTIDPHFSTVLDSIELHVTHVSTDPHAETTVDFQANLDQKGRITMQANVKPLSKPLELETNVNLNDYALGVLTPYVGKYTGRELKDGKLDLSMNYRIGGNKLIASHHVLVQKFEFGKTVESKDALHLPFGLAVALLEDPHGRINIALPASGDMSDPKFEYFHLIGQVIRNFFLKLVTKPFSFIAATLGGPENGTEELSYVQFVPGRAALTVKEQNKLSFLIKGLTAHPKLRLEIDGSYDPQADWKEMQAVTFAKDYEKLRKESSRPEPKVYQLLYQRRFGIRALWALAKKYKEGIFKYDDAKLDQEIKRQLIEKAPPDIGSLNGLAQSRAHLVYEYLLINGFNEARLSIGHPQSTQSSMGYVPLQFTLTVFDKT